MTSGPHTHPTTASMPPVEDSHHQLRLRLKPKAEPTGHVDGGWWPRTRDLVDELPGLTEVLAVRLGPISRIAYAISAWDDAPRRVDVDGRVIRLEGFRSQDERVVHVSGQDRRRISLLVVPPEAREAAGHDALMLASHRGNKDRPTDILTTTGAARAGTVPGQRTGADEATDRWEAEGGHA